MKRLATIALIVLTAIILTNESKAQNVTRWGVTAGANYNLIHFKDSKLLNVDHGWGPQAGITGEMEIAGAGFAVDGSVLYSMRTSNIHYGERIVWNSLGYGNENCTLHYVDVPLSLKFKYHKLNGFEDKIMPMIAAGPTFSFLAAKNLPDVNSYKPVSILVHLNVGCEIYKRLQISAGYNFSVGETLHTRLLDENVAKNRCWSLTATWFIK
ncbi:MAG: outer membrane beta-barrel protein [Bacteroidales bacterium]|nr:outer membrane beta-barrel protein [Candidatus Sodaliphilus aphodohippi]